MGSGALPKTLAGSRSLFTNDCIQLYFQNILAFFSPHHSGPNAQLHNMDSTKLDTTILKGKECKCIVCWEKSNPKQQQKMGFDAKKSSRNLTWKSGEPVTELKPLCTFPTGLCIINFIITKAFSVLTVQSPVRSIAVKLLVLTTQWGFNFYPLDSSV